MAVFYLADFYGLRANPCVGIVAYLVLPGILLLNLILIPLGMALKHYRAVRRKTLPAIYPRLDFNRPELRRVFHFVVLATAFNAVIFIHASYGGHSVLGWVAGREQAGPLIAQITQNDIRDICEICGYDRGSD